MTCRLLFRFIHSKFKTFHELLIVNTVCDVGLINLQCNCFTSNLDMDEAAEPRFIAGQPRRLWRII